MKRASQASHLALILFLILEFLLFTHQIDPLIFQAVSRLTGWQVQATWAARLQAGAWIALHLGLTVYVFLQIALFQRTRSLVLLRRFRQWFMRFPEPAAEATPHWKPVDGLILLLFVAWGIVYFLGMLQQGPFPQIDLGGDAANLTSFAAGLDHPGWFARDGILSDPKNLQAYSTINIQLIRWLAPLAGSYALAYALPILILVPLSLAGFYLFGLVVIRHRFWAFLLAVSLAVPLTLNMGETWGIPPNAVTRFYFQALIPYLLALAFVWRERPARWPWPLFLVGLMAFIHPVSTPGWAAALWCGCAACLPERWPLAKKAAVLAALAGVTLLGLLPYAVNYLGAGSRPDGLRFEPALTIIEQYFPSALLNVPATLTELGRILWNSGLLGVSFVLGGSLLLLPRRDPSAIKLLGGWLAGTLLAGAVLPWLEHTVELALRITPYETELVRGLRYTVFFLILFSVWALAEWQRRLAQPRLRLAVAALGIGLAVVWAGSAQVEGFSPLRLVDCLRQGRLTCELPDDGDRLVEAVSQLTPEGAAIYSTFAETGGLNQSMPIRYQALRALVFCYKDHGQLVTTHSPAAETWLDREIDLERIVHQDPPEQQMDRHFFLAHQWGATHVITDLKVSPEWLAAHGAAQLYQNETYTLIQLDQN